MGLFDKLVKRAIKSTPAYKGVSKIAEVAAKSGTLSGTKFAETIKSSQTAFIKQAQEDKFKNLAKGVGAGATLAITGPMAIAGVKKIAGVNGVQPVAPKLLTREQLFTQASTAAQKATSPLLSPAEALVSASGNTGVAVSGAGSGPLSKLFDVAGSVIDKGQTLIDKAKSVTGPLSQFLPGVGSVPPDAGGSTTGPASTPSNGKTNGGGMPAWLWPVVIIVALLVFAGKKLFR